MDLSAPGFQIKSNLPMGKVGYLTGTSQATAFVSGVAALLLSQFPNLKYQELKNILLRSAKKEQSLLGQCLSQGQLDAGKALEMAKAKRKSLNLQLASEQIKKHKDKKLTPRL